MSSDSDLPALMAISPARLDRADVAFPELAPLWERWIDALEDREPLLIQVRARQLSARRLMDVVKLIRGRRVDALAIVNGRVDVAIVSGADGVQLPERGLPADRVRSLVARDLYVGRSVHDPDAACEAARQGADWVTLAPIYRPLSKRSESPALGVEALARAAESGIAVYALGGIQPENRAECLDYGAHGVAGISMFDSESRKGASPPPAL